MQYVIAPVSPSDLHRALPTRPTDLWLMLCDYFAFAGVTDVVEPWGRGESLRLSAGVNAAVFYRRRRRSASCFPAAVSSLPPRPWCSIAAGDERWC